MLGNARNITIFFSAGLIFLLVACSGSEENATTAPLVTTSPPPPTVPSIEVGPSTDAELDLRFEDAVTEYVKTSWGTWSKGKSMGQCLIANAGSITKEAKEAVIEHGIEEAFDKLSGDHLQSLGTAWDLCESEAKITVATIPEETNTTTTSTDSIPMLDFEPTTVYDGFPKNIQAQFKNAVDEQFDAATEKAGISAAVYQNGYLWRYAKGKASSLTKMTVGTPILIRSTSKTFLSGLVLQQIDGGLYSLSDTLSSVLSGSNEYTLLNKDVINPDVTVEQLLNMTSGISHVQNYYRKEISELQNNPDWRPIDLVRLVITDFVSPGKYNYSNTNTILLGLIAEHKGNQKLNELYKSELLDPLGLVALLLPEDDAPLNTARPHDDRSKWSGTGFGDISESSHYADWYQATGKTTWAAAGIITTPENLARWAYELFSEQGSAISPTARASLLNSFVGPLVEIGPEKQQYGYHATKRTFSLCGCHQSTTGSSITAYGHPGSGGGFVSDIYYSPELDISVALVINSHSDARTRAEAQGKLGHRDLDEIAQKIFDAISLVQ